MENTIFHSSHKVYRIKYHIEFCVKYRKNLFTNNQYVRCLIQILSEISKRYNMVFETIGIDEDHVHILVQTIPRYSPSQIFQIIKSIAAKEMFKRFPDIKNELWGGEFWSDSGYVGTVGEGINAEVIRNYIKKQGKNADQLKLTNF